MKTVPILSADEIGRLLRHVMSTHTTKNQHLKSIRNTMLILLMLEAGLRVGETVQLRRNDLYDHGDAVQWLRIRAEISKTKVERCVPLSNTVKIAIGHMQESYWPYYGIGPDDWAFAAASKSRHITVRQVQNLINILSRQAIKRCIRPHILRHTFASRLMKTANIRVVQQLLGHARLSSTQIYTHPDSNDLKNAIDATSML